MGPETNRRNFWIVTVTDAMLCLGAYYTAYLIRFDGIIPAEDLEAFQHTVIWVVPLKMALLFFFNVYRGMWRYTDLYDLFHLLKALSVGSGIPVFVILILYHFQGFSRGVFLIDLLLSLFFLGSFRVGIRLIYLHRRGNGLGDRCQVKPVSKKKLAIVGAGRGGEMLLRDINEDKRLSYEVVGFVDDDLAKSGMAIHGIRVLGTLSDLIRIAKDFCVDEIIIATPSATSVQMRRIVDFCKSTGLPFRTVPGISELIEGKVRVSTIREVRYEDLLGRKPVEINADEIGDYVTGKRVLVTGAAGSIGSELCRQIALFNPSLLVMLDRNESGLYDMEMEFKASYPRLNVVGVLAAIQNKPLMEHFFDRHHVQVVFHAAAYKHVPMMELHPWEAIFNNVLGTQMLLDLCSGNGIEKCVIISSDKAVRPTNVMGATKRLTELIAQAYAKHNHCRFMAVRFGNVMGSAGSVVPLFRKQIAYGGPVTVTHKDITRYFMSIPEACRLVLQAGAIGQGGEIFVLKMGEPIRIDSLARDMITLSGFTPEKDIAIEYVGLRPGEKLYEELITDDENVMPTGHEKIMVLLSEKDNGIRELASEIRVLMKLAATFDVDSVRGQLCRMVKEYVPDTKRSESAVSLIPAPGDDLAAQTPARGDDVHHGPAKPVGVRSRILATNQLTKVNELT